MNKYLKWGFVAALAAGVSVYGYFQLTPRQNEELATVENAPAKNNKKVLNVTAKILKPQLLTD